MKVHHLNCGSMTLRDVDLVCHVLLVETDNGLVLVDSGFGSQDCVEPGRRIGPTRHIVKPLLEPAETAAHQLDRLGFRRDDVRHVVITHFDADHIGGLADFPHASIHVTAAEARGSMIAPSWREKIRYRAAGWEHGPKVVEHIPDGEKWRGFAAAEELEDISPGLVLIALPGHTRGHACVAVDAGHRWVLHCGDAFYHYGTLDGHSRVPRSLTMMESVVAFDRNRVRDNHARLAELFRRDEPDLLIVNAHDPSLYARAQTTE